MFCSCMENATRPPPPAPAVPPSTTTNVRGREDSRRRHARHEGDAERSVAERRRRQEPLAASSSLAEDGEDAGDAAVWLSPERLAVCVASLLALLWSLWRARSTLVAGRELVLFAAGAFAGIRLSSRGRVKTIEKEEEVVNFLPAAKEKSDAGVAARMAETVATALSLKPGSGGWDKWGRRSEVEIYLKTDPKTGIKNSVGVGTVAAPAIVVADAVESEPCKALYDKQWKRTSLWRECDKEALQAALSSQNLRVESFVIRRDEYHAVFPATARDCVVSYCRVKRLSDGAIVLALNSVRREDDPRAHAHASSDRNYVRMHVTAGAYVCRPSSDESTEITSLVDLDPRGAVPTAVINFVAVDRPMGISRIRDLTPITDRASWPSTEDPSRKSYDDDALEIRVATALDLLLKADRDPESAGFVVREEKADLDVFFTQDKRYTMTRGRLQAPVDSAFRALTVSQKTMDKMRDKSTILATFGKAGDRVGDHRYHFVRLAPTQCTWITYKPNLVASPRDAVVAITDLHNPRTGARIRVSTSIHHLPGGKPMPPVDSSRVRMSVFVNGWIFKPGNRRSVTTMPSSSTTNNNSDYHDDDESSSSTAASGGTTTLATNLYKADPNGGLPNRLRERLAKARSSQIPRLRSLLEQ